jgi:hypothetical protein
MSLALSLVMLSLDQFSLLTLSSFFSIDLDGRGNPFLTQDCPEEHVFAILYGAEAEQACDHADCLGQTWCDETGDCSHSYCDGKPVCNLPWLRIGAHCNHDDCYSLLQCRRIGRPLKKKRIDLGEVPAELASSDTDSHSNYSSLDDNDDQGTD